MSIDSGSIDQLYGGESVCISVPVCVHVVDGAGQLDLDL